MRPLEREEIDRLLDDADERAVAARVLADGAELLLGQVAALTAEPDPLLYLADCVGERERLLLRHAQEMESKPLRRPRPDPREARQLRDQIVDERAEQRPESCLFRRTCRNIS
jgi:hypothetical protein